MGRVGFELAADLGEEHAQVVCLLPIIWPPHLMQQLLLTDQSAGVPDQQFDQLPLGRGQPDLPTVSYDLLGGQVDAEVRGLHDRDLLVGRGARRTAARRRASSSLIPNGLVT